MTSPNRLDVIDRTYGRLLRVYPREFRERFGQEMLDLFRARRRAAASGRHLVHRVGFALGVLADLGRSAWRERRHQRQAGIVATSRLSTRSRDDLHTALRRLRRSPALTLTIVALMALTIGSATAVFSVVNAILLRPLPFGDPSRMVVVWERRANSPENVVGGHEFPQWEQRTQAFERMAALIYNDGAHLAGAGDPKSVLAVRVSAGFLDVMGVAPAVGRGFTRADDTPGAAPVAMVSDRLWRERFGASSAVVGRSVRLNDRPVEIVGVMPPGFGFPAGLESVTTDVWTPIAENIEIYAGRHYLYVMGRLKPGISSAQAQADMTAVALSLEREMPELNRGHGINVIPFHEQLVEAARPSLRLLMGAVVGLVLIGCSNVAGLLFARGLARRRAVALELALGATPGRVARQLLTESVLLSVAGGALGLAGAGALTRLLPILVPPGVLATDTVRLDPLVLAFAASLSILTGLIFGAAPALQLRHFNLSDTIRRGGRTEAGGDRPRVRRVLVTSQIALAVMLVIGAGLMARGLVSLQRVDPGFQSGGLLAVDVSLRGPKYSEPVQRRQFFDDVAERLRALPGVEAVGATNSVPLSGGTSGIAIDIEGRPASESGEEATGQYRIVTPGYFETMGVTLREGRTFTASDARVALPLIRWWDQQPVPAGFNTPQARPVGIVNEAMARRYWPDGRPIGRRFRVLFSPWITVVGVVADTRNASLRHAPGPEFYLSASQEPQNGMNLMIRTTGSPADLAPLVRRVVRAVDPDLPIAAMRPMDAVMGRVFDVPRFMSWLLGAFAVMALTLMTAGVYGLVAFTTTRRRSEMGVRLALGARRHQIEQLILRDGLTLAVGGLVIGIIAALLAGQLIADQLYGVAPTDRLTFIVVTVLVLAVVLLACWLPARRASRVDPIVVLRQD
jgi:putative ABC transport system permease protein